MGLLLRRVCYIVPFPLSKWRNHRPTELPRYCCADRYLHLLASGRGRVCIERLSGLMTVRVDYADSLLATSLHAVCPRKGYGARSRLDLTALKKPVFYDRLVRARVRLRLASP